MTVEAIELQSRFADYLRQVRSTGETLTICEGAEPIVTLSPVRSQPQANGTNLIDRLVAAPIPVKDFKPLGRDAIYARG